MFDRHQENKEHLPADIRSDLLGIEVCHLQIDHKYRDLHLIPINITVPLYPGSVAFYILFHQQGSCHPFRLACTLF